MAAVDRLTDDAIAITFDVPPELRETFEFRAGQHLTVRRTDTGEDVRRSYSICSTPAELESLCEEAIAIAVPTKGLKSK